MYEQRLAVVRAVRVLDSDCFGRGGRARALVRGGGVRLGDFGLGEAVDDYELALLVVVAHVARVDVRAAGLGAGASGDVLPVARTRALDSPRAAPAPRAVEGVDEGAVARVVVSPEEAGVASRGDDAAALVYAFVLERRYLHRRGRDDGHARLHGRAQAALLLALPIRAPRPAAARGRARDAREREGER